MNQHISFYLALRHKHPLQYVMLALILLSILFVRVIPTFAQGALSFTATASPTTVQTGEIVQYLLDFSCGGVSGACGTLNIPFEFDDDYFEIQSVTVSDGFSSAISDGPDANLINDTITITDSSFQDGDAGQATILLRAKRTLTTGQSGLNVSVSATITNAAPSTPSTITITSLPDIDITPPTEQWSVNKSIVAPGVPPTTNDGSNEAFVRYNVNYCSDSATGNVPINGAVLVDELPNDGVNVLVDVIDIDGGTRIDADGTINPNGIFVRWILSPNTPLDTTDDLVSSVGCVSRTVEYQFPDSTFDDGVISGTPSSGATTPSTTNSVRGYRDGEPADYSICPAGCVGDNSDSPTLGPPQGEPNPFKSVSDTRPIPHPGVANFRFGFNTNGLNLGMSGITIGDNIPPALDGRPALDVYEVLTGTWDNAGGTLPDATLRIRFFDGTTQTHVVDGSGQTFNFGDPDTTYTAPRVDDSSGTGNLIDRVEIEFPEVPPEFSMSGVVLRFTPRDGMTTADYEQGGNPFRDYENCAILDYSTTTNPAPVVGAGDAPGGFNQACADARITNQTDSSIINWSKSRVGSGAIQNNEVNPSLVEFQLALEYTDQSSGQLPSSIAYRDVLNPIVEFVDYDSTQTSPNIAPFGVTPGNVFAIATSGFGGGDNIPDPYLRIEYDTPTTGETTLTFIWSDDPSTDSFMNPASAAAGAVWYQRNGTPIADPTLASPNGLTASAPDPGDTKTININFKTRVKAIADGGRAGTYNNQATLLTNPSTLELGCPGSTALTDSCDADVDFTVQEVAEISAFKWTQSPVNPIIHIRPDRSSYNGFITNPDFACSSPIGSSRVLRSDLGTPVTSDNLTADNSRSPCAAQGNPGEIFDYLIEVTNDGNIDLDEFILYDILPYINDTGVSQATVDQDRLSEFVVWLADPAINSGQQPVRVVDATFAAATVVEYSTSSNPCRPEMSNNNSETWDPSTGFADPASCNASGTWVTSGSVTDWTAIRSFRVRQTDNSVFIPPSGDIAIEVTAYIPTHDQLTTAGITDEAARALTGEVAWNNYAYRFTSESTNRRLLTAEPRKAGIRIPERLSIGNRVWIDDGTNTEETDADDRERDDTTITNAATTSTSDEAGVDGVVLELYRWDGSGSPPAIDSSLLTNPDVVRIAEATTANGGYYLFEIDQRARGDAAFGGTTEAAYDWFNSGTPLYSLRPGQYIIYFPASNFNNSGNLYNYISSNGVTAITSTDDDLDRGIDNGTGTEVDPDAHGVISDWFELEFDDTPEDEPDTLIPSGTPPNTAPGVDADPHGPYGRGNYFQRDTYSNLVMDFGFIKPMALGNRIWIDDGRSTDTTTYPDGVNRLLKNDGIFNSNELAVDNVVVQLYRDENDDGTIDVTDSGDLIETTSTENGGYYLFPNLKPGEYIVHIPDINFLDTGWTAGGLYTGNAGDTNPGPLFSHISSTGNTTQQTTHQATGTPILADFVDTPTNPTTSTVVTDNGVDDADPSNNGISSPTITLVRDGETQAETDFESGSDPDDSSGFVGSQAVENRNNDLTVDFSFVPSPMSLGNRVWIDDGLTTDLASHPTGYDNSNLDNGVFDDDEAGVEGVVVNLYIDPNGDGDFSDGFQIDADPLTAGIQGTTTDISGYYLFDNLIPSDIITSNPNGAYIVEIDNVNFASTGWTTGGVYTGNAGDTNPGPLFGYFSSTSVPAPVDGAADENDHGIDNSDPATNGIISPPILLTEGDETQLDDETGTGTDSYATPDVIPDNNSDLTVDFGFIKPMAIGNRVWRDIDRTTGTPGDGIRQSTEEGISGVTVQLFIDTDNSGDFNTGDTQIAETVTDAQGFYLFDRQGNDQTATNAPPLGPNNYIVHIPASNFSSALNGLINSDTPTFPNNAGDTALDSDVAASPYDNADENGQNDVTAGDGTTYPQITGVSSSAIQLRYENEVENEPNRPSITNPDGEDVEDDNSNLTVDFGFYNALAIGNRVWFDRNRNGVMDALAVDRNPNDTGTIGIAGLTVYLYNASDLTTPIAVDVTDSEGYYIFDVLDTNSTTATDAGDDAGTLLFPGDYVVGIDRNAGNNSTILLNHVSTITRSDGTTQIQTTGTDAPRDNDDNGLDRRDGAPNPTVIIYSETITLLHYDETTTEDNADKETGIGDGRFGIQDHNSNLTVDFGFYIPMSIGNRVWFDANNDGLIDAGDDNPASPGDPGINNVIVELFLDANDNGLPDAGEEFDVNLTTVGVQNTILTTSGGVNGNGYYIFDDLPEGDYIVRLSPLNFVPDDPATTTITEGLLTNTDGPYSSSESGASPAINYLDDSGIDNNDNGVDENLPQNNGIRSNQIQLRYNEESSPLTAPTRPDDLVGDLNPTVGEGTFGELDQNADMTVDFGVYAPLMSLGNRVFYDYNNNRRFDGADVGVDGVRVNLFRDNDQNNIPDSGINNPLETTTTANGGYYIFDGLDAGYYLVQIDEVNFRPASSGGLPSEPLFEWYSSQDKASRTDTTGVPPADDGNDDIENGIDYRNPTSTPDPFEPEFDAGINRNHIAEGVFSQIIHLVPSGEVTTEAELDPDLVLAGIPDGEPNIQQSNSDLTIDFGFYRPMSIGNVVWIDSNNDGLQNNGEVGVAGVTVELYNDVNGNDVLDVSDTLVQHYNGTSYEPFDTTNADGYYLFDNLLPGDYLVHIPASNFATLANPLFSYTSSIPNNVVNTGIAPAPDADLNDNGINPTTNEFTEGVTSEGITLGASGIPDGSELTGELDKSNTAPPPPASATGSAATYDGPTSIGRYGELDENSDITIDFGFVLDTINSMAIGNRVWFDEDRNGLINGSEAGIDGVLVYLYRSDASGNIVGNPVARDITQNGGYYIFDRLDNNATTAPAGDRGDGVGGAIQPGNYIVAVAPDNFNAGQPLENYTKTIKGVANLADPAPTAADDDSNDNGNTLATLGILSDRIELTLGSESATDSDKDSSLTFPDGTVYGGSTAIADLNSNLTVDFGFYVPMSLGNRVWIDTNNNGVFDPGESTVPDGVTLTLFRDDNSNNQPDSGEEVDVDLTTIGIQPYQVSTTNGYYLFEDLLPGDYIVRVDGSNFATTSSPLFGYTGSNNGGAGYAGADDNIDRDDNGSDATVATLATDGIPSGVITLALTTEPINEEVSGNPADGPNGRGNNGESDPNSDLTVDFGVFPSNYYSIGNRVWLDDGSGSGTPNDGIHQNGELGVAGVIVNLYRNPDGDNDPSNDGTFVTSTTTDANGFYLFDSLPAGNYIVSLAPSNFGTSGALQGYSPTIINDTTTNPDNNANDDQDNVNDIFNVTTFNTTYGYFSNNYTLEGTAEPVNTPSATPNDPGERAPEGTPDPQTSGTDPSSAAIPDNQSNLTVDFGFVRSLSMGNLVWFDVNNDGLYDSTTENGIAGVTVELYLDANNNGIPEAGEQIDIDTTTPGIQADVTDSNGYYLYDNLQPGDYIAVIPNANNWVGGSAPLAGMQSSTVDAGNPDGIDSNDNGGDSDGSGAFTNNNVTDPANGVRSQVFTLAFGAAPLTDTDVSNNPADGPNFTGLSNPTNANSDLSIDFGFFNSTTYSIGNRVWLDDGRDSPTTTNPTLENNGFLDPDELGIPGVTVELYRQGDTPGTTPPTATDVTDTEGYYIFDNLPSGNYFVHIPKENWTSGTQPLAGYTSSEDPPPSPFANDQTNVDSNDRGADNPPPQTNGVSSPVVDLSGSEPTGEDESPTDGRGRNGVTDPNSNLTIDFGFFPTYDWGDAPDSYSTTTGAGGANHRIVPNLYMGTVVDGEDSGVPQTGTATNTAGDSGVDSSDENGVTMPPFVSGTTVNVDVTVVNRTGQPANLIAWFDWDGDDVFDQNTTEGFSVIVPNGTDGVIQIPVVIPNTASNLTGGDTYARFRLTTDSLTVSEPTGRKNSGEVEDYYIQVEAPGLLINKSDGLNSIVAGGTNTYTVTIENSGNDRSGVVFRDSIQLADATTNNGYDPETVTWTCVATNGASCIAGQPAGTGSSGGPYAATDTSVVILESLDLPENGRVVYTINGRVNPRAGLAVTGTGTDTTPIDNTAQLPNETPPKEDPDRTFVIFDPPFGVKTGVVTGGNIIRWTMVWYNPGSQQTGVTITDTITAPQQLPSSLAAIDLQCTGSSGACNIVGNTITWNGTMETSTPTNTAQAVVISFNVIVPGSGNYTNTGTINFPSVPPISSTGDVPLGDPPPPPPILIDDPVIVKFVDPTLAQPGEPAVWTIRVINPNNVPIDNVVMSDNIPEPLRIQTVTSTSGVVSTSGQNVTVTIPTLQPNEIVTITIDTLIDVNVVQPIITNIAFLNVCDCADDASIFLARQLPATGETPAIPPMTIALMIVMTTLTIFTGGFVARRRLQMRVNQE